MSESLANQLQRLCCAETEGKFFDCVTDNIDAILKALRSSGVAQGSPDCGVNHTEFRTNIINHCANICKTMREKHGSPTGDAYTNGVWDQGVRDEQAIRGLIEALSLPSTHSAPATCPVCGNSPPTALCAVTSTHETGGA